MCVDILELIYAFSVLSLEMLTLQTWVIKYSMLFIPIHMDQCPSGYGHPGTVIHLTFLLASPLFLLHHQPIKSFLRLVVLILLHGLI